MDLVFLAGIFPLHKIAREVSIVIAGVARRSLAVR
jgi:hypothetical protein